ncbi:MAG: hypothetical protein JWM59_4309 [Verrucomicrobiales bacterium]|nr:hypothetical protein [Verrucomicrobiales bacterium]
MEKPRRNLLHLLLSPLVILLASLFNGMAAEPASTPWQLERGRFPPESSALYLAGELILVDHVNRTGQLRPDRRSDQRTDDYDRALSFTMLPYGTLRYHGAPAELRDIPIGTHLHGQFYFDAKGMPVKGGSGLALLLEDDFSFHQRRQRAWRLDTVNLDKGQISVTGLPPADNQAGEKPTVFKVNPATRVWKDRGFGALSDLAPGQNILFNITAATLKGPGLVTDIWLDDESRRLAAARQNECHRAYQKSHGLPGWIDAVDNGEAVITVTLFGGFDPGLKEDFKPRTRVAVLVAEESLRTYDQLNDRMYGELLESKACPAVPGGGGLQVVIKVENLLEGFRPRRIVRVLAEAWPLDDNPWEENLYPGDNRVK